MSEQPFRATTLRYRSHRVLLLTGELGAGAVAELEAELLPLLEEAPGTPLVVDLSDATLPDDAVAPTLVEAARLAAARSLTLTVSCPAEQPLAALRAMDALRHLSIWDSTPDAVEAALTR